MHENESKRPIRPGGYSFEIQRARRNKRRDEAEARQAAYDKLTPAQQQTRVYARGGSEREIARIRQKIADAWVAKANREARAAGMVT